MAVRFIIGRAGSGKTHHCVESIRQALEIDPIEGPRLVLLVPEQAGSQMERAVLQSGRNPGAHRAEVLSFQRLAYRILDSAYEGGAKFRRQSTLTEAARAMVLGHLISSHTNELRYYRRVGRLSGFFEHLSSTVAELIQEAIDPECLNNATDPDSVSIRPGDPAQEAKLHDLHWVYSTYLAFLGTDRLDPCHYLQEARALIPRSEWLHGAEVWVDGFASFSGQEIKALLDLALCCRHVEITMMFDPQLARGNKSAASGGAGYPLFHRILHTYGELVGAFQDAEIDVLEPVLLDPSPPPRFRDAPTLERLERHVFRLQALKQDVAPPAPSEIEVVELPNRRIEVDYAATCILQWVRNSKSPCRFRDTAIIVRDLEVYHELVAEALSSRSIPFFLDHRRPACQHPLVELLRGLTAVAVDAFSLDSVQSLIKTCLLPIPNEALDELENYILAHGVVGIEKWKSDWPWPWKESAAQSRPKSLNEDREPLQRVNGTRQRLVGLLSEWMAFARADAHMGMEWADGIRRGLDTLGVAGKLSAWTSENEADGRLNQAQEHREVWKEVMSLIDDLGFAFETSKLKLEELVGVLDAGLPQLSLGLIPPTVDQVLVGSIERSRHPDIQAAVLLGFNEGLFPKQDSESSILNDDDRTLLRQSGIRIGPPAHERAFDEASLAYIALTRTARKLVVCYATADENGKALTPSPYIDDMRKTLPGLSVRRIADPIRTRDMWNVVCHSDWVQRVAMEFRVRPATEDDDPILRGRWNELYQATRDSLATDLIARRALTSLDDRGSDHLSAEVLERLYAKPFRTSISQLETYAECPFKHFAKYGLRLRERPEACIKEADLGRIYHAILEGFVRGMTNEDIGFEGVNEADVFTRLGQSCEQVVNNLLVDTPLEEVANAYTLRRSAVNLARILLAQRHIAGLKRPKAVEQSFGFEENEGLPALKLATTGGRDVLLRGVIDRIDLVRLENELLGIVIDYKSAREKALNPTEVYHGLSLQLPAYLLVLEQCGESLAGRAIRAAGAVYLSLSPRYELVNHPDEARDRPRESAGVGRAHGLIREDAADAFDSGRQNSLYFNLRRTKNGDVGFLDASDVARKESFQTILEHTKRKLTQLADGLLDGQIAVSPIRLGDKSPCTWCAMRDLCRFEMGIHETRFLELLNRKDALLRMSEEGSHEAE